MFLETKKKYIFSLTHYLCVCRPILTIKNAFCKKIHQNLAVYILSMKLGFMLSEALYFLIYFLLKGTQKYYNFTTNLIVFFATYSY